jgi:hypothetical protein
MNPETIIQQASTDGLKLTHSTTGEIKLLGTRQAVDKWKPLVRERKAEIIETLKSSTAFWR